MEKKIAVVEKNKASIDSLKEYFDFNYDRFQLTNSRASRVLKKDVTLDSKFADDYDYVVLVGADPARHIGKITNVTKYAGHLINDKYIPIMNPAMVKFKPEIKDTLNAALKKVHAHVSGTYEESLGQYKGIDSAQEAKSVVNKMLRANNIKSIAVDIETSALYPREGYILGIALSAAPMSGVYISSDCIDEEVEDLLQQLFNQKICVFHNAKFDMKWLMYHFRFKFPNWEDTMLQHYLLNENEPHDLKSIVMKYTKMGDYDSELDTFKRQYCKANGLKLGEFSYEYIPFDIMQSYAGGDVDGTIRAYNKFNPIIQKHFKTLYEDLMKKGTMFLLEMEENGVPFDKEYLRKANEKFTQDIFDLTETLYTYPEVKAVGQEMGAKFNPNSTAHLKKLFFEKLGLPLGKKTPKGEPSTDKEELERLSEYHSIPNIISEIRGKVKIKSTYITKIMNGLDSDSKLRTGFHLHTVTSGRLSSSGKLNMQQLPRDDKTVKSCIRSVDPNYVIFSQDLTTAEMYYAAVLSKDQNLAKVFRDGGDFHSSIAKMTFDLTCPVEEVASKYPKLRQAAKAISFGILYGAGPGKVAQTAGIGFNEAESIIKQYYDTFSQLKQWIENIQDEIRSQGYIYSAFGRKRRVANVFSTDDYEHGHAVRSAMNFTLQSVASDVNLLAAIDTHEQFKKENIKAEIFGLVHDSILGQCHKDSVEQVQKILLINTQKDRNVGIPNCPIGVDFGYGSSYAEAG